MLGSDEVEDVRELARSVAAVDGEAPLNEEAGLALVSDDPALTHHLRRDGQTLVGYAQSNGRLGSAQLFVHPAHRRRGIGGELLLDVAGYGVWAFGDLPAARAFAADKDLVERRRLLVMERPLEPPGPEQDGVRVFRPDDLDGLLAVNAAAFDWHPEQRHFSRADAEARMAEDWFDPDGLLVTEDADGVTGFHWTKRHPDGRGEVYILATHPRAQGGGLGRRLLAAGLDHLARTGSRSVHLYVEAANARAVELYERAGFAVVHSDVQYGPVHRIAE